MISNEVLQLTKQRLREHLAAKETASDPVKWCESYLGSSYRPYEKLANCMRLPLKNRMSLVYGVNASGKSFSLIGILSLWWAQTHGPNSRVVIITPSFSQSRRDVDYCGELLEVVHERFIKGEIAEDIRATVVGRVNVSFSGTEIIQARNPLPNKASSLLKGSHSTAGTLILIDEADAISPDAIRACMNVLTGREDRLLAVSNPKDSQSYVMLKAQKYRDTGVSDWAIEHIGWEDLPGFTHEPVSPLLEQNLLTQAYVDEVIENYGLGSPEYEIYVAGYPALEGDMSLIRAADITIGCETQYPFDEVNGEPRSTLGIDLALFGNDNSTIFRATTKMVEFTKEDVDGKVTERYMRPMTHLRLLAKITSNDVDQKSQAVWIVNNALKVNAKSLHYDAMGLGMAFGTAIQEEIVKQEAYDLQMVKMIASSKTLLPNICTNNRAAFAVNFKERLHNGEIDIDPEDTDLINDLLRITYKLDGIGRIQLTAKRDMVGKSSPDFADAAFYACILDSDIEQMIGEPAKKEVVYEESGYQSWVDDPDPFDAYFPIFNETELW